MSSVTWAKGKSSEGFLFSSQDLEKVHKQHRTNESQDKSDKHTTLPRIFGRRWSVELLDLAQLRALLRALLRAAHLRKQKTKLGLSPNFCGKTERTMALLVTAFVPANKEKSIETYLRLGQKLLDVPCPKILFTTPAVIAQLRPNEYTEMVPFEMTFPSFVDVQLPEPRNAVKDTAEFLFVMSQKTEFCRLAMDRHPEGSHFAWLDFGLLHVCQESTFAQDVKSVVATLSPRVRLGHIWPLIGDASETGGVQWYFAGGVFGGPRDVLRTFADACRTEIERELAQGHLTWEVNRWYRIYRHHPEWFAPYACDHNSTILRAFHEPPVFLGAPLVPRVKFRVTFVTSLHRDEFRDELRDCLRTLAVPVPLVIFCANQKDANFARSLRDSLELSRLTQTHVRGQAVGPCAWLREVVEVNPFGTTHVGWMDANLLHQTFNRSLNYVGQDIYERLLQVARDPKPGFAIQVLQPWRIEDYDSLASCVVADLFFTVEIGTASFLLKLLADPRSFARLIDEFENCFHVSLGSHEDAVHNYYEPCSNVSRVQQLLQAHRDQGLYAREARILARWRRGSVK
jgi:hypothetical protein